MGTRLKVSGHHSDFEKFVVFWCYMIQKFLHLPLFWEAFNVTF